MDNEIFISKLRLELTKPLPGATAQLKMAPSYRHLLPMDQKVNDAGVVLLIYPKLNELTTVFMKRTEYPGVHSGQISFPGGRFEEQDATLQNTALRETEEEFGIQAHSIDILGKLTPLHIPVSHMEVHPFVGYLTEEPLFSPDPIEVDSLIEITIRDLMNPSIIKSKSHNYKNFNGNIPYYDIKKNHVWGATAMILAEFMEIVKQIPGII